MNFVNKSLQLYPPLPSLIREGAIVNELVSFTIAGGFLCYNKIMKFIENVLICGLGAIGTIYADKIQKFSPENLKILVDKERFERYSKSPVIFNGNELHLNYILPDANDFKADLIIIATKYDGLNDAIKNIKNFVKSDTIILSLLNGITSEKIIADVYGREHLLYSYFIGHSAIRKGRNITQDGVNTIVFGSDNEDDKEKIQLLREFFNASKIKYEVPDDIIYSMWLKFLLNVSSNQTSAVLGKTFGEMMSSEKCMDFIVKVMKEVIEIAKAEGVNNADKLLVDALKIFKTMSPDGKTSMLQDIEAKRKTEVDMFAGVIIELGKKHNIHTPHNILLQTLIKEAEKKF